MRELTTHKVNGYNKAPKIQVVDDPGMGGASHKYDIFDDDYTFHCYLKFQNGPIAEAGVNGVTNESLLAIVIDRLESFQSGPFACYHNEIALLHLHAALASLKVWTAERIARGVERTHTP